MPYPDDPYGDDGPFGEEQSLWVQEAYQDAEAWALAEEEGWYYAD